MSVDTCEGNIVKTKDPCIITNGNETIKTVFETKKEGEVDNVVVEGYELEMPENIRKQLSSQFGKDFMKMGKSGLSSLMKLSQDMGSQSDVNSLSHLSQSDDKTNVNLNPNVDPTEKKTDATKVEDGTTDLGKKQEGDLYNNFDNMMAGHFNIFQNCVIL